MPKDATPTRERIMNAAQALILEQGYAGTSVDRVIEKAGITKGTFFYHFPAKQTLAEALVRRWADMDIHHLETNLARARALSRDPLQQLTVFVGLFIEQFDRPLPEQPGCLYASFIYETELTDTDIAGIIRGSFDTWRDQLAGVFEEAARAHPPRITIDAVELIDLLGVIFEGAFILSRVYGDTRMIAMHLRHYRNYLELAFGA